MTLKRNSRFMLSTLLVSIALGLIAAGCATHQRTSQVPIYSKDAIAREIFAAEADSALSLDDEDTSHRQSGHKIPIEINKRVNDWIDFFTVRDRERFHRFLKRGEAYRTVVQQILKQNNVPPELYYLAMIESGFATHATSHASAVGIWQFIRGTGTRYGLKTDRYIDERRDPIRASEAAAKYLGDLHRMFNSWYLAMAGYNAGEYRIMGAIRRGNSRDFWELADRGVLPRETMNYIPKFLAAVIIGRNPAKFGFTDIEPDINFPALERVRVAARYDLNAVARAAQIDSNELKRLNPQLRIGRVPHSYRYYSVWMPKSHLANYKQNQRTLVAYSEQTARPQRQPARLTKYRVQRGDTLHAISTRFGIPVRDLMKLNGLRRTKVYSGQSLRIASTRI